MCRVRWIVIPTMILLIIGLSILHHWILTKIQDETEKQGFCSSKLTILTEKLYDFVQIGKLSNYSDPIHACYEPQDYLQCESHFEKFYRTW